MNDFRGKTVWEWQKSVPGPFSFFEKNDLKIMKSVPFRGLF